MKVILYLAAGFLLGWLVASWTLMVTVGVVHHEWWDKVPTMSYGASMAVLALPMAVTYAVAALRGLVSD